MIRAAPNMKGCRAFLVVVLAVLMPGEAFGLSCAVPRLDETAINAAIMIFEGTAGPKRKLTAGETRAVRKHGLASIGGGAEDLKVYSFVVTRGWKGAATGQAVDVLINTYWGDGFAEGETYLVVSPQQVGNLLSSPLCGHTGNLKLAAELGNLATLERLIGSGQN